MFRPAAMFLCTWACSSEPTDGDDDDDDLGMAPVDVDMVVVVDNSPSMADEIELLGLASADLFTALADAGVDYRIGLTTTSVDYDSGPTVDIDLGEAGLFVGEAITPATASPVEALREQLFCSAVNWDSYDVPSDPTYACGDDPGGTVTQEYLDCLCGPGWQGNSGSGDEEPLEASLLALCRGVSEPPDVCYDPLTPFEVGDEGSNGSFLRSGALTAFLVVTDEGDNSRRLAQGDEDPAVYIEAWSEVTADVDFFVVGPNYEEGDIVCATTSVPTWSVERMQTAAQVTGGEYGPVAVEVDGECGMADIGRFTAELAAALGG